MNDVQLTFAYVCRWSVLSESGLRLLGFMPLAPWGKRSGPLVLWANTLCQLPVNAQKNCASVLRGRRIIIHFPGSDTRIQHLMKRWINVVCLDASFRVLWVSVPWFSENENSYSDCPSYQYINKCMTYAIMIDLNVHVPSNVSIPNFLFLIST